MITRRIKREAEEEILSNINARIIPIEFEAWDFDKKKPTRVVVKMLSNIRIENLKDEFIVEAFGLGNESGITYRFGNRFNMKSASVGSLVEFIAYEIKNPQNWGN